MKQFDLSTTDGKTSAKRLLILGVLGASIALYFWTQSRFPQLNHKELMGDRNLISLLSFDPLIPVASDEPLTSRLWKGTINWYYTNYRGMTFGLLFAATILSILALISFKSSRSTFVNALVGMFIGTPLGVCTNCAAPISQSLNDGGSRLETSLATLVSSPTLNIIVLTMLFGMFPFSMAVLKVGLTLLLVLGALPLLAKYAFVKENSRFETGAMSCGLAVPPTRESWLQAFMGASRIWLKSFAFILVTAVPLMLLSGFLGVFAVELVPAEFLSSVKFTWGGAVLFAFLGTFLPVPMTFDLVLANVLMSTGLHKGYAMILLFTLGPFSIYPFLLLWKAISLRVVTTVYITVMLIGIGGGVGLNLYDQRTADIVKEQFNMNLTRAELASFIDRNCSESGDKDAIQSCSDFIQFHVARRQSIPNWTCKEISNGAMQERCLAWFRSKQWLHEAGMARFQKEARNCFSTSGSSVNQCLLQLFDAFFEQAYAAKRDQRWVPVVAFTAECRGSPTCTDMEIFAKAVHESRMGLCASITDPAIGLACNKYTTLWAAKQDFAPDLCLTIEEGSDRLQCLIAATSRIPQFEDRIKVCSTTHLAEAWQTDPEQVASCERDFLHNDHPSNSKSCGGMKTDGPICLALIELDGIYRTKGKHIYEQILSQVSDEVSAVTVRDPANSSIEEKASEKRVLKQFYKSEVSNIAITSADYSLPSRGDTRFTLVALHDLGIRQPDLTLTVENSSVATGDYDNDGWIDIAIGETNGIALYRNLGNLKFSRVALDLSRSRFSGWPMSAHGFVDINNDGYLDIAANPHSSDVLLFILNGSDGFKGGDIVEAQTGVGRKILSFADVDKNGLLDFVVANTNDPVRIFLNKNMHFQEMTQLPTLGPASTWSALFTDINHDNSVDLFIGNDFDLSDNILLGTETGGFRSVVKSDSLIRQVSTFNMGYESADVNNDLKLDIMTTEAHLTPGGKQWDLCESPGGDEEFRTQCKQMLAVKRLVGQGSISGCWTITDLRWKRDCLFRILINSAWRMKDKEACSLIPDDFPLEASLCLRGTSQGSKTRYQGDLEGDIPQVQRNVLNLQQPDGSFVDKSVEFGIAYTYWAWNARFHDYDNDSWQDVFVVNKTSDEDGTANPNMFFKSRQGTGFEDVTKKYGLEEHFPAYSYAAEDFDLDGDIDILMHMAESPYRLYQGHSSSHPNANSIQFQVIDRKLNHFGIGTKIYVYYGSGGRQIREIKSNGGYLSPNAPAAHFGLGADDHVDRVEVVWTDGERMQIDKEFPANRGYTIERR